VDDLQASAIVRNVTLFTTNVSGAALHWGIPPKDTEYLVSLTVKMYVFDFTHSLFIRIHHTLRTSVRYTFFSDWCPNLLGSQKELCDTSFVPTTFSTFQPPAYPSHCHVRIITIAAPYRRLSIFNRQDVCVFPLCIRTNALLTQPGRSIAVCILFASWFKCLELESQSYSISSLALFTHCL